MLLLKDWCLFRDEITDKWVFHFSEIEKAILMRQRSLTIGNLLPVCRQGAFSSLCMDGWQSFLCVTPGQEKNLSSQVEGLTL